MQPTLQKAVDAGIPVVLIDTNISTFDKKAAFVGTDNKLGGQLAGEFIAKALKAGDEVAIIRGAAGDPVHNLREEGAKEAMDKAGLKVVAVQPADSDRAKGQTVAENLLTANPNLKAIYRHQRRDGARCGECRQGRGQDAGHRRLRCVAGCARSRSRRANSAARSRSSPPRSANSAR